MRPKQPNPRTRKRLLDVSTHNQRRILSSVLLVTAWLASATAFATVELRGLDAKEWESLRSGGAIERRFELPHRGSKYLAAVSYALLERPCSQLTPLLKQPVQHLAGALPATREVRFVERRAKLTRLRVVHGNDTLQGEWGALYRVAEHGHLAQFWLDTESERDVEDVFGYLRLSSWEGGSCLITAAVAVDPGKGLLASLFRSVIHNYLVRSAARIQRYARSVELASVSTDLALASQ